MHRGWQRRRLDPAAAALLLAGVAVILVLGGSAAAQRVGRAPRLTLTGRGPVTVQGTHFTPRSRVHVTLTDGASRSRDARPDAQGRFTVGFSAVIDRCTAWMVVASQRNQARVVLRGPARPMCAPAGAA
ncbi:MAG: hypothetical protein M3022_01485 [Actinomycetota bacterium]|nr:hypothetical protein [Actinomycetota bacterium]